MEIPVSCAKDKVVKKQRKPTLHEADMKNCQLEAQQQQRKHRVSLLSENGHRLSPQSAVATAAQIFF